MPINLKKAISADIPTLIAIEKSVADANIYSPMLEESEWEDALRTNVIFVIEKEGVVAGNISYEKKGNNHAYISGLVIVPQFQGQGIARGALVQILKELGNTKRIDLVTHPNNIKALALYQSLGFVVESRKENYYGDGEPRLVLAFQPLQENVIKL